MSDDDGKQELHDLADALEREERRMTRDEFIDGYLERSGLDASHRRPWGYQLGERKFYALPCTCDDEGCDGWAMISADPGILEHHLQFHMPIDAAYGWREAMPPRVSSPYTFGRFEVYSTGLRERMDVDLPATFIDVFPDTPAKKAESDEQP